MEAACPAASFQSKGCMTMAESVAAKAQDKAEKKPEKKQAKKSRKKSYLKSLKAEFKKIVWPDRETVAKQTVVVLLVSLVLGLIIGVMDMIFKFGINLII